MKLHALTETRDFEALDAFARSRRSPIGYQPFVRHLIRKGHAKEAANYVPRCDANTRADLYVECGEWRMAGKECKERGDKTKMEYVHRSNIEIPTHRSLRYQTTAKVMSELFDRPGVGTDGRIDEVTQFSHIAPVHGFGSSRTDSHSECLYGVPDILYMVLECPPMEAPQGK